MCIICKMINHELTYIVYIPKQMIKSLEEPIVLKECIEMGCVDQDPCSVLVMVIVVIVVDIHHHHCQICLYARIWK